jgi:predicted enzyme related to lactoylglutathione lyase
MIITSQFFTILSIKINISKRKSKNDFLAKIDKLGRNVIQLKPEGPEIGWIAAVEDPEDNLFALNQPI